MSKGGGGGRRGEGEGEEDGKKSRGRLGWVGEGEGRRREGFGGGANSVCTRRGATYLGAVALGLELGPLLGEVLARLALLLERVLELGELWYMEGSSKRRREASRRRIRGCEEEAEETNKWETGDRVSSLTARCPTPMPSPLPTFPRYTPRATTNSVPAHPFPGASMACRRRREESRCLAAARNARCARAGATPDLAAEGAALVFSGGACAFLLVEGARGSSELFLGGVALLLGRVALAALFVESLLNGGELERGPGRERNRGEEKGWGKGSRGEHGLS